MKSLLILLSALILVGCDIPRPAQKTYTITLVGTTNVFTGATDWSYNGMGKYLEFNDNTGKHHLFVNVAFTLEEEPSNSPK